MVTAPRGFTDGMSGPGKRLRQRGQEKTPVGGNTGVFSLDDQRGGILIAASIKQQGSMIVQVDDRRPAAECLSCRDRLDQVGAEA